MKRVYSSILCIIFCFVGVIFPQAPDNFIPENIEVAFPFYDDVEDTATSSSYWTRDQSIWKILAANAHSGTNVWAMLPATGTYKYLTLSSSINLSSTVNPYILLWTRKADGGTGSIAIEVSTNGGTNWTVIREGSYNGNQYTKFQASLLNYRQSNVLIRIGCYVPYGNTYFAKIF